MLRHPLHRTVALSAATLTLAMLGAACDPRSPQPKTDTPPASTTPGTTTTPAPPASAASR